MYDVVTFGEGFVRLSPPGRLRLEQTHSLQLYVGGAELAVAAACSRLGLAAAWVSRVPGHPLGRMVVNRAREHGVDVSRVIWADEGRVPLCFVEFGAMPRAGLAIWDDGDSGLSRMQAQDVDWSLLTGAKLLHVGADTPALNAPVAEATIAAFTEAKTRGCKVSFHLRCLRRRGGPDAAGLCESLVQRADLLIADPADAQDVFGTDRVPADAARQLKDRFALDAVAIPAATPEGSRRGAWTGIALGAQLHTDRAYDLEIVDTGGVADAFAAGIIHGYLRGDLEAGLRYANALAAIAHTHPGELCYFTRREAADQLDAPGPTIQR
ncbi:MAG: sugar kinase [Armatimonadota bacterium]|jgi:2-dehydro-3-deoxygluconokinase